MTDASVQETIITGIVVGIVTTIIISILQLLKSWLWTPYSNFKHELTSIDRDFVLYSNVFTSTHDKKERDVEFNKWIYDAQNAIRARGIDLKSKYDSIPNVERHLLCMLKKLPPTSKIIDISGELISISASAITYNDDSKRGDANEELASVRASTEKIEEFIEKYGKLHEYK